ncbi:MAG: hypothetical protein Q7J78_07190 [Clostridiales bacterium]|nr:hypothetical protein [Clostridiales bacterium]
MQIMLLRHPTKGTIGDQKRTFLDHRGILPAEVCPLTLNAKNRN